MNTAPRNTILQGDVLDRLRELPDGCVQTCVTSPPYWGLRDYGVDGQIGLEPTPAAYVARMVEVFREVRRVLRDDGTCWVNLGDSYAGSNQTGGVASKEATPKRSGRMFTSGISIPAGLKAKDLCGIPWRVAFALQDDGWYLRADIIWSKPNPMPESVTDRPTRSHEMLYLLTKSARYYYDAEAIKERASENTHGGKHPNQHKRWDIGKASSRTTLGVARPLTRNKRDVWTVATAPFSGAHFATFPPKLVEPCILAGSRRGDIVLDPFSGAGTVALVAKQWQRDWLLVELNPAYVEMAARRLATVPVRLFADGRGA